MTLKTSACCLALWLTWAGLSEAQVAELSPSKSNSLIQVTSASAQQLSNGLGDIYVGRTNQDGQTPATISIRRGLVAFDIADNIPAGALITNVTLSMEDVMGLNGNQTITLSQMLRDWGEGTSFFSGGQGAPATNGDATWYYTSYNASDPSASPAWTAPGGQAGVDYSATVSAATLVYAGTPGLNVSWSSTANTAMLTDVQQWLDAPATNFGWIMLGNEGAGQTAQRFGGKDAPSGEVPPELTIQYDAPWTWTGGAGNAVWSASGNWTAGTGLLGSGAAIVLGGSQATSGTVNLLATAPSISHLTFEADKITTVTSTAAGGCQMTLDNGVSPVGIVVSGSAQSIIGNQVSILLNSDAWITTGGSSCLSIAADITSGTDSHGIIEYGQGELILSGDNSYTGGTTVDSGIFDIAGPDALPGGTTLAVAAGGTVIFDTAAAGSPVAAGDCAAVAVPEPAELTMMLAALAFSLACAKITLRSTIHTFARGSQDETQRTQRSEGQGQEHRHRRSQRRGRG